MAISAAAYDNAEWTFCDDVQTVRGIDGGMTTTRTEQPWAFIRFADPTEPNRYIMPVNGCALMFNGNMVPRFVTTEIMPYMPFPLEASRPARTSGGGADNAGGPIAIHFYGWI
jgi:hypothetical protein